MTENSRGSLEFRIKDVQVAKPIEDLDPRTLVFTEITNTAGRALHLELHLPIVLTPKKELKADILLEDHFQSGDLEPDAVVQAVFGFDPFKVLSLQYGDRIMFRWSEEPTSDIKELDFTVTPENTCELVPLEVLKLRMKSMAFVKDGFESMENEEYLLSIDFFSKALEYDPKNPVATGHRGLAYSYLDDHEAAVRDYSAALALNDSEVGWCMYRGISYFRLNRKEEARQDLERYLREGEPDEEETEEVEEYLSKCG